MRHARHNHGTGPAGAWPSIVASATAVGGVLVTTLGGGEAAADTGTGVAALGGVVVGGVLVMRQRECAARQAETEEARRAEQADHARELARRDSRIDELAEEVTAMTDDSGVLRRQMDELRSRFDDEMSFRVRLETEFDRLAEWARGELGRASTTLEATRDQLEQALHRAVEAEAELSTTPEAPVVVANGTGPAMLSSADAFAVAQQALNLLWSADTVVETSAPTIDNDVAGAFMTLAPGDVTFAVGEPLPGPYYAIAPEAEAVAADDQQTDEQQSEPALGERLYRPFVLGVVTEQHATAEQHDAATADDADQQDGETALDEPEVTTTIDLTAYDETSEFSVRTLRREQSA